MPAASSRVRAVEPDKPATSTPGTSTTDRKPATEISSAASPTDTLGAAKAAPAPRAAPAPPPAAVPGADGRPPALTAARDGGPDNLKLIKGIGPKNEAGCNGLGVYHFEQIALWTPENATWVGRHLAFPGRIERESWIDQARLLSMGIDTTHAAAVKSGAIVIDETADTPLSEAEAAALKADLPAFAAPVDDEAHHAGARPVGLAAARGGAPDDLQRIKGIGKQNEARLHALGIWHFVQIANWSPDNISWVGSYLAFPGRIARENWVTQAAALATGGASTPTKPSARRRAPVTPPG